VPIPPCLHAYLPGIGDAATLKPGPDPGVSPRYDLALGEFRRHQRGLGVRHGPGGQDGAGGEGHHCLAGRMLLWFPPDGEGLPRDRGGRAGPAGLGCGQVTGRRKCRRVRGRLVQGHRGGPRGGPHRPGLAEDLYRPRDLTGIQGIKRRGPHRP
jgi:hypothetical protein